MGSIIAVNGLPILVVDSKKAEKRVLFKCATGKKTSERVEDKLVILEALEKNLIDYNKLRDQFVEIFEEIKQLNDPTTTSKYKTVNAFLYPVCLCEIL